MRIKKTEIAFKYRNELFPYKTDYKILLSFSSFRRCNRCKEKNKIIYIVFETDYEGTRLYNTSYCEKCSISLKQEFKEIQLGLIQEKEHNRELEREQERLNYLKREIEKIEVEEKAKHYGITYPEE